MSSTNGGSRLRRVAGLTLAVPAVALTVAVGAMPASADNEPAPTTSVEPSASASAIPSPVPSTPPSAEPSHVPPPAPSTEPSTKPTHAPTPKPSTPQPSTPPKPGITAAHGLVWQDLNGDGQQQKNEPALAHAGVWLSIASDNGLITPVDFVETTATGRYTLTAPKPGKYNVLVATFKSLGFSVTKPNVGKDATDSDITPVTLTPAKGANRLAPSTLKQLGAKAAAKANGPADLVAGLSADFTVAKGTNPAIDAGFTGGKAPAPTASPAPGNGSGTLPTTGAAVGGLLGGGAALLAGGAAMVVITRRRRIAGATTAAE